jgi:hypothetical protein
MIDLAGMAWWLGWLVGRLEALLSDEPPHPEPQQGTEPSNHQTDQDVSSVPGVTIGDTPASCRPL